MPVMPLGGIGRVYVGNTSLFVPFASFEQRRQITATGACRFAGYQPFFLAHSLAEQGVSTVIASSTGSSAEALS